MKLYSGIIFLVCVSSLMSAEDGTTSVALSPSTETSQPTTKEATSPEPSPTTVTTTPAAATTTTPSTTTKGTAAPTTAPPTTTAGVPTTTGTPVPEPGTWEIKDGNKTCIRAKMEVEFVFQNGSLNHYLSQNATTAGSSCGNTTQTLELNDVEYLLKFIFIKAANGEVSVQNLSAAYPGNQSEISGQQYFLVSKDKSYKCDAQKDVQIDKTVTLRFTHVQLEAFDVPNGKFNDAESCWEDVKKDDPITIAVACTLVALVVIVLVTYFVFRYRNSQRGYDTF